VSDVPGETVSVYPATLAGVMVKRVPLPPGTTFTDPEPVPEKPPGLIVQPAVLKLEDTLITVAGLTTTVALTGVLVPAPLLQASV